MWFDMIRTRKVHNDVTGNWDDFVGHKTVYDSFTEKQLLFPDCARKKLMLIPNVLPNNPWILISLDVIIIKAS